MTTDTKSHDLTTLPHRALELAIASVDVDRRITFIGHPEDEGTELPVVLETSATDDGGHTSRVVLAKDLIDALDKRLTGPRYRSGTVQLTELESLIAYLQRYGSDSTVIYADTNSLTLHAVIDEHPAGAAGELPGAATAWRQFRARYACPRSSQWIAWAEADGQAMKQDAFADFLESRLEDMIAAEGYPAPLEVLGVARQLHIRTKGEFRREINPTTGDHVLINKSETDTGSTAIPRAFQLAIPVFVGGERYRVEARVRFQLTGSGPMFSYTLHRRAEIERDAFTGVRTALATATGRLVLAGNP